MQCSLRVFGSSNTDQGPDTQANRKSLLQGFGDLVEHPKFKSRLVGDDITEDKEASEWTAGDII